MADLPDPDKQMSYDQIKNQVELAIFSILKNEKQNNRLLKRTTNVYGLYQQIIIQVVRRDSMIIRMLEFIYGLVLASFSSTFIHLVLPMTKESQTSPMEYLIVLNSVFMFLSILINLVLEHLEEKIKLKIRLGLQYLVYQKLLNSDVYFLENADNNLVFRLLYADFDDFVQLQNTWFSITPIVVLALGISIDLIAYYQITTLVLLISLIVGFILLWLFEWLKLAPYLKYKTVIFEQRKIFYEFIINFKAFALKDLKPRFAGLLEKLRVVRNVTFARIEKNASFDVNRFSHFFEWCS